jgi:pyruvate dehydrogenase E2 component (dihydrolipoyllysine-residue acetyltransferase)
MATEVKLPRLGQGMESGTIVRWLKAEGEEVRKREPLYELDTDKVTQEVEAEADGVLLKIVVAEGEVDVGATIAVIGKEGEAFSLADATEKANGKPAPVEPSAARAAPAGGATDSPLRSSVRSDERLADARVKASPLARRMARERGIDLMRIVGTGPEGRIVAEDVANAAVAAPATAAAAPLLSPAP